VAIDYLYEKRLVKTQRDRAVKIGITETSISRLRKGQRGVSYETLRKLNETFGNIFNMQYFRGESDVMLVADIGKEQPPTNIEVDGTSSLLEIAAQLIKDVECIRRELQAEREQTRQLNEQLIQTLQRLHTIAPTTTFNIASEE
jgi:transcriptional regulator with XRE-family HTH domain